MKRILTLICIGFSLCFIVQAQSSEIIKIQVNAAKKIATVSELFNGTNIEDLNHQTNGGIFSQLLMGEAFEESVDIDFLNLPVTDYVKICVIIDEMRRPNIALYSGHISTNNLSDLYDINSFEINNSLYPAPAPNTAPVTNTPSDGGLMRSLRKIGPFTFNGNYIPYDSIPRNIRTELDRRANGEEQISRYWAKMTSGSANGRYILPRGNAYMGRQDQIIKMEGGNGEFGLFNKGLNKQGIKFVSGKPYEGVLRVKAEAPAKIYLSIRDENGKILRASAKQIHGAEMVPYDYQELRAFLSNNGQNPQQIDEALSELRRTDAEMSRAVEDVVMALLKKGVLKLGDLPKPVQERMALRVKMRMLIQDTYDQASGVSNSAFPTGLPPG